MVKPEYLTVLRKCQKLETLIMIKFTINDSDIVFLKNMTRLSKLSFAGNVT